MKYFSVPADFKNETIDKYYQLNHTYNDSRVIETYGNVTSGIFLESGRSVELLPKVDMVQLQEYVEYSRQKNIDFNYTINASHMNNKEFTRKGILEIISILNKLYKVGVRSLTIALPSLMEIVQSTKYDFKIKASTLCQITNASKAMAYKEKGVEKLVLDESVYKDFYTLKKIRNCFGDNVEIIANAICHKNCLYRMFHYNQMSSDSMEITNETSANYYSHRCVLQRYERCSDFLRLSWVRPEDIKYYTAIGIKYFKLQGRQAVLKGDPVRAVESYFKESYDGDLLELLDMFSPTSNFRVFIDNKSLEGFIKPFYQEENFCKRDCSGCDYCDSFANNRMECKKVEKLADMANEFYSQYDPFKQMLDSLTREKKNHQQKDNMDADFRFD